MACVLDENFENGVVLGAVYSDADAPPVESPDKLRFQFFDHLAFEVDLIMGYGQKTNRMIVFEYLDRF